MSVYILGTSNAEAWFNIALRPRKPEGSSGRTAQDGHLDSHTAPELCCFDFDAVPFKTSVSDRRRQGGKVARKARETHALS